MILGPGQYLLLLRRLHNEYVLTILAAVLFSCLFVIFLSFLIKSPVQLYTAKYLDTKIKLLFVCFNL